jgi:hypothetical protein
MLSPMTTPPRFITRTGLAVAVGPITGFGSVIVNGVTYDTDAAEFTSDGVVVTQDDLKAGQYVLVQGTIDDNDTTGTASSVTFDDNVEGPVSSVDSVAGSFVVLGQTVLINDFGDTRRMQGHRRRAGSDGHG